MAKNSRMQVLQTTDYDMFVLLEGNRDINKLHRDRLLKSVEENYLFSPIIVNEHFEVIDGQHRLSCAQELGLPVYYIVCEGYGLREIQRYNATAKVWNLDDFLSGYIELGKKEYVMYKAFKEKYDLGHREAIVMLTGINSKEGEKEFKLGNLKIKKYNDACVTAEKLLTIAPYYSEWKRRSFISAILHLLKTTPFLIEEFVPKLKFQQSKMVHCSRIEEYIGVIEKIYNFKRADKISLRYTQN